MLVLVALGVIAQFSFSSRNGHNTVYCGPFGGPSVQHDFLAPVGNPGDDISVTAQGPPASGANAHLAAAASASGLVLSQHGAASRAGAGVLCVADSRDAWGFAIATTSCFSLSVLLDVSGTVAPGGPSAAVMLAGTPGQFTLSDGSVVSGFSQNLTSNGHIEFTVSGTIRPGTLSASLTGRADPNNTFPYQGAYTGLLSLTLCAQCDSVDFNGDGLFPDTADIDDFLSVFSGGACSTGSCGDIDFNNDGLFPDTLDIDSLLSVFSGGACL